MSVILTYIFRGDSITKIKYTSEDFDNERPPVYTVSPAKAKLAWQVSNN